MYTQIKNQIQSFNNSTYINKVNNIKFSKKIKLKKEYLSIFIYNILQSNNITNAKIYYNIINKYYDSNITKKTQIVISHLNDNNSNANINLSWVKFDDKDDPNDEKSFREANDVFNITSLFGYKLTETLAASTLAEYRTTLINNFNDPGYLDVGVGVTWTPLDGLIVVVHPINYNFVFADNDAIFESSFGAKVVANYAKSFAGFDFNSNLSAFISYKDSNLSNWTWINSLSYKVWKSLGLGFELGLRDNKQEAVNFAYTNWDSTGTEPEPTFDNVDNDLQVYYTFGLSYSF